jgi:hypothetical protein
MMNKILSIVLALLGFLFVSSCSGSGDYTLHLVFPEESAKAAVDEVELWALEPGGYSCDQLLAGEIEPTSLNDYAHQTFVYPSPDGVRVSLPAVPARALLFFAEARNGGRPLLRGCARAEVKAGSTVSVEVLLSWVCKPNPEGEIPNNNLDDDCDGKTDEYTCEDDCLVQNQCAQTNCEGKVYWCLYDTGTNETLWMTSGMHCTDGNPCTEGDTCVQGACRGKAKECVAAPSSYCEGNTRVKYKTPGFCQEGECGYEREDEICANGCNGGICLGPMCEGVRCNPGEQCVGNVCVCEMMGRACHVPELCCDGLCKDSGTEEDHCGACEVSCDEGELCMNGECRCGGSGPDCLGTESSACCGGVCVDVREDKGHCGDCEVTCQEKESCLLSQCVCGPNSETCTEEKPTCCDDACADLQTDALHCGSCTNPCHTNESCQSGQCRCGSGNQDCTGGATSTCCGDACVDMTQNINHCGGCDQGCEPNETCIGGRCLCGTGQIECNRLSGEICCGNACVNMLEDEGHCGSCANACKNDHGTTVCTNGTCVPSCDVGWMDCDSNPNNGCEGDVNNVTHCGSCTLGCANAHGTTSCQNAVCVPNCNIFPWDDCDSDPRNGCDTDTGRDNAHCGNCLTQCDTNERCVSGLCHCSGGTGPDCTGANDNFCCNSLCVNLNTDGNNCGSCGHTCTNAHGTSSCVNGGCRYTCDVGFDNCDGSPDNGCETDITSTSSCGDCSTQCNSGEQCANGLCKCGGVGPDCAGTPASTCCGTQCVNVTNDTNFCGNCNKACTNLNGTTSCVLGTCTPVCSAGFLSCDSNVNNGCETDVRTISNCGTCGKTCTNAHGSTVCSNGNCVPSCSSGWNSCDGNPNNGCETQLGTVWNCNSCGNNCGTDNPCLSVSCSNYSCQQTPINEGALCNNCVCRQPIVDTFYCRSGSCHYEPTNCSPQHCTGYCSPMCGP